MPLDRRRKAEGRRAKLAGQSEVSVLQLLWAGNSSPLESALQRWIADVVGQLVPLLRRENRLCALDGREVVVSSLLKSRLDVREDRCEVGTTLTLRELLLDVGDQRVILRGERSRQPLGDA